MSLRSGALIAAAAAATAAAAAPLPPPAPGVYHFESAAAKGITLRHCDYIGYAVPLDAGGDPNFQFNVVAATTNDPAAFSLTPIA